MFRGMTSLDSGTRVVAASVAAHMGLPLGRFGRWATRVRRLYDARRSPILQHTAVQSRVRAVGSANNVSRASRHGCYPWSIASPPCASASRLRRATPSPHAAAARAVTTASDDHCAAPVVGSSACVRPAWVTELALRLPPRFADAPGTYWEGGEKEHNQVHGEDTILAMLHDGGAFSDPALLVDADTSTVLLTLRTGTQTAGGEPNARARSVVSAPPPPARRQAFLRRRRRPFVLTTLARPLSGPERPCRTGTLAGPTAGSPPCSWTRWRGRRTRSSFSLSGGRG